MFVKFRESPRPQVAASFDEIANSGDVYRPASCACLPAWLERTEPIRGFNHPEPLKTGYLIQRKLARPQVMSNRTRVSPNDYTRTFK
jgi:hypothetical protein